MPINKPTFQAPQTADLKKTLDRLQQYVKDVQKSDGSIDMNDPDCEHGFDNAEASTDPSCVDDEDNDGDGWTDEDDPDCDIVVDEQEVSRKHARLVHNQMGYFELIDLSSTNGTLHGEYAIPRMVLDDGDSFHIGQTEFTLHLVEEEAPLE